MPRRVIGAVERNHERAVGFLREILADGRAFLPHTSCRPPRGAAYSRSISPMPSRISASPDGALTAIGCRRPPMLMTLSDWKTPHESALSEQPSAGSSARSTRSVSANATGATSATSRESPPASPSSGCCTRSSSRPDGRLIAGERRLRAAKLLGWTSIPVTWSTSTPSCAASSPRTPCARISRCRRRSPSSARSSRSSGRRQRSGNSAADQVLGKFPKG